VPPGGLGGRGTTLRPWQDRDAPALVEAWADPEVTAWSRGPDDRTLPAAQRWIEGWDERRTAGLALDLVIADPADECVGEVGLTTPAAHGTTARQRGQADEAATAGRVGLLGWWLLPRGRGRGLASSTVAGFSVWLLGDGGFSALGAAIHPDNERSILVAERAGFRRSGTAPGGELVFRLARPQGGRA